MLETIVSTGRHTMKTYALVLRSAAALACLLALSSLQAATVTYDFSVAVMTGPAAGSTAFGHFSYDSASVIAGGGYNSTNGLLTDLAFALDGMSYTELTANTGALGFNSLGGLSSFLIGTSCGGGRFTVGNGITGFAINFAGLTYARTGTPGIFNGSAPTFALREGAVP
ncbi:MAG: hypothetical protein H7306_15430 [Bacteriovorax sp.]|nr:hypothetical protein [Rhizobacter sp.]